MKRWMLVAAMFALPVQAASVSNLDEVAHTVVFEEVQGSKVVRTVEPGSTIHFRATTGAVYLKHKPDHRVQIRFLDRLAIWPESKLSIQMRRRNGRNN